MVESTSGFPPTHTAAAGNLVMEGGGGEADWARRAPGVQAWARAVSEAGGRASRGGGSGSGSGVGCTGLMPTAPRRPSGPAGVPVRQVAGAFAGAGIWPPRTVLSPSG